MNVFIFQVNYKKATLSVRYAWVQKKRKILRRDRYVKKDTSPIAECHRILEGIQLVCIAVNRARRQHLAEIDVQVGGRLSGFLNSFQCGLLHYGQTDSEDCSFASF